ADIGKRAFNHEPGFLDSQPEGSSRVDALGQGVARSGLPSDSKDAQALGIAESILHFPQLRGPGELNRAIAALDGECQLFAGLSADNTLHGSEAFDLGAVDADDDITDLEPGRGGRAVRLDLVNTGAGAGLAEEGEETGENHDRQDEIGDRAGGNDRRTGAD